MRYVMVIMKSATNRACRIRSRHMYSKRKIVSSLVLDVVPIMAQCWRSPVTERPLSRGLEGLEPMLEQHCE